MWLFKNIVRQSPYGDMSGAKVRKGCIVSWTELISRHTLKMDKEENQKLLPKRFDKHWQNLFRICQEVWNGTLDIKFADGRPIHIVQIVPGDYWDGGPRIVQRPEPTD